MLFYNVMCFDIKGRTTCESQALESNSAGPLTYLKYYAITHQLLKRETYVKFIWKL